MRVEDERLGPGAVGQLRDVLGEQQVQPAQPVVAGHRQDAPVRAVDDGRGAGHRPLLGEEVAAVGGHGRVRVGAPGRTGSGSGGHRASRVRQSRQRPDRATCATSSSNPKLVGQPRRQVGHHVAGHLGDGAAVVAHEVHVLVLVRGVGRGAVPEVRVAHQPQAFEQVQAAVHRGDVHRRCRPLDLRADLLGGRVAELADGVEHELALRRHPQPALVQGAAQRRRPAGRSAGAVRTRDAHR